MEYPEQTTKLDSTTMTKGITRADLIQRYAAGENISALLRGDGQQNSEEIIEVAYDLQAGSYVKALSDDEILNHKQRYAAEIAGKISTITGSNFATLMEAGVGESTTLSFVLENLGKSCEAFGFDISWSRIYEARKWMNSRGLANFNFFTASLFDIPLPDNSIDVVYTSHSIEPNGGKEEEALRELYRVAAEWLVLLEPAYDLASSEAQQRMKHHGYCVDLYTAIQSLGYEVTEHRLFPLAINPMNPTGITVIRKPRPSANNTPSLCCPATGCSLKEIDGFLFSVDHLAAYPVLDGIPCLRVENSILASHLMSRKANTI